MGPFTEEPEKDLLTTLQEYNERLEAQVSLNELNVKDIQLDLPNKRHYWAGRLVHHKACILKLQRLRKTAVTKAKEKITQETPIGLDARSIKQSADNHPVVQKIDDAIADHEVIVEYLTKIENNFRALSFDIKNLIALIQLETT